MYQFFSFRYWMIFPQKCLFIIPYCSSMKKYQLWLQRKSYSQHLFNLMRIKSSNHSPQRLQRSFKSQPREGGMPARYKELQDYQLEAQKLGDISYAITFKELKNRKLRLMRTFEILNQNMSMARRIKGVKSAVSPDQKPTPDIAKRKQQDKKCELSNDDLRQQNFRKFVKLQHTKENIVGQKYRLSLAIIQAPRVLRGGGQFAACWMQVQTGRKQARSQMVQTGRLQGSCLTFALQHAIQQAFIVRLYASKGLESSLVASFRIYRPQLGELVPPQEYTTQDGHIGIIMRVSYNWIRREKPSFTLK